MDLAADTARASTAGEGPPVAGADLVLAQVWWLLRDATEQVRAQAQAEGLLSVGHPLALGMELLACRAANLMSRVPADWWGPEHVPPGVLDSLLAAESLTRSVPVEAYPAGVSDLVVRLCDLIAQARSAPGLAAGPSTGPQARSTVEPSAALLEPASASGARTRDGWTITPADRRTER